MLKTIVIEDEPHLLQMLSYFLQQSTSFEVIGTFRCAEEALHHLHELQPDCIFLDIEMPGMNGIEFASRLTGHLCQIIFTTAYEQYALDALKLEASEYLLKPISLEQIEEITPKILRKHRMLQAIKPSQQQEDHFSIQCFGSFNVYANNQHAIKWPTRKVEELFAYLLVHANSVVNKWRVAEDLWPGKSLHNIYNSVYLLNKTLKEHAFPMQVENMNEGYTLQYKPNVSIDLMDLHNIELEALPVEQAVAVAKSISQKGTLFQDKDYRWATIYKETTSFKHQQLLEALLAHYRHEDSSLFECILNDYTQLYDV